MKEYTVKVYDNRTEWFLNGKRHREDGPAIEDDDECNGFEPGRLIIRIETFFKKKAVGA